MQSKMIKTLGHSCLREAAPLITEITDDHIAMINRMKLALASTQGYAIAANQLGFNLRIFVHNINNKYEAVINPRIGEYDDSFWFFNEGCLSVPGFYFPIWRPKKVLLRGQDTDGNDVRIEASDLLARVFQHETDHLNGKLVIDLLSKEERSEFDTKWLKTNPPKQNKKKSRKK